MIDQISPLPNNPVACVPPRLVVAPQPRLTGCGKTRRRCHSEPIRCHPDPALREKDLCHFAQGKLREESPQFCVPSKCGDPSSSPKAGLLRMTVIGSFSASVAPRRIGVAFGFKSSCSHSAGQSTAWGKEASGGKPRSGAANRHPRERGDPQTNWIPASAGMTRWGHALHIPQTTFHLTPTARGDLKSPLRTFLPTGSLNRASGS